MDNEAKKMENKDKPNTRPIPIIITLAAAFISCVVSIYQRTDFGLFTTRLLIIVVVFLVLGTIIRMLLDYSFRTLEPVSIDDVVEDESQIDGEVLEKETSTESE